MQLTFLGTGAGMPAKERNVASIALSWLNKEGEIWLFDCGEATQHQLLHTSLKPRKIARIFITHLHGDHIFGLLGLLSSRSFLDGTTPLFIYGPAGIRTFIETGLDVSQTHLRYSLHIEEIQDGWELHTNQAVVSAKQLKHGIPSFGFRICEHAQPGTLLVEKLRALHVTPGPIYQQLKEGVDVLLEDGRLLVASEFVGPKKKGRIVTILGDTRPTQASVALAKGADVLIHEATFSEKEAEHAVRFFHSTTKEAVKIAKESNVRELILTHISARFQGDAFVSFVEEAKHCFPSVTIASDFLTYSISRT